MNTTSMPGSTLVARSIRTASCIDSARHGCGAKWSTAHWMTLGADQCSNSEFSSASSSSWKARTGSGGGSTRKLTCSPRSRSHACALAGTDFGGIRPGLVVVDVVVGPFLGRGELVELLELGGDRLGPAGPLHPGPERLAGGALVREPADDPHGRLGRVLGRQAEGLLAEVDLRLAHVAAQQHLVAGRRTAVRP